MSARKKRFAYITFNVVFELFNAWNDENHEVSCVSAESAEWKFILSINLIKLLLVDGENLTDARANYSYFYLGSQIGEFFT